MMGRIREPETGHPTKPASLVGDGSKITEDLEMEMTTTDHLDRVKQSLSTLPLSSAKLEEVKNIVLNAEVLPSDLANLQHHVNNLSAGDVEEVVRHIRSLQNHQTPLLRLPRELRDIILDLVALGEWCVQTRFSSLASFGRSAFKTCQQLRAESAGEGRAAVRLIRMGMEVKKYDYPTATWKQLSPAEVSGLKVMGMWVTNIDLNDLREIGLNFAHFPNHRDVPVRRWGLVPVFRST
ncbi:hypothetical protein LTR08_004933 [Meristemomyces frigidus]|nr:hypothetical protein LTR08_004933 [Meristemomyces frigidus]